MKKLSTYYLTSTAYYQVHKSEQHYRQYAENFFLLELSQHLLSIVVFDVEFEFHNEKQISRPYDELAEFSS